MDEQLSLT